MPPTVNRVFPENSPADLTRALREILDSLEGQNAAAESRTNALGILDLRVLVDRDMKMNLRRSRLRALQAFDNHLCHFFQDFPLRDYTAAVTDYVESRRAEDASAGSIKYELAILRRGVNLAHRQGLISSKPYIPSMRVENARKGFISAADLRRLLPELKVSVRPLVEFAWLTGWRRMECLNLKWSNIDWTARTIRLEPGTTKNGKGRMFPFGTFPRLRKLLEEQLRKHRAIERRAGREVEWVFCWRPSEWKGTHNVQIRVIRRGWHTACRQAGLEGRVFHDLRRSAVRRFEQAGIPRSVAMQLSGHETESIYRRYAIVAAEDLEAGVARLAALRKA